MDAIAARYQVVQRSNCGVTDGPAGDRQGLARRTDERSRPEHPLATTFSDLHAVLNDCVERGLVNDGSGPWQLLNKPDLVGLRGGP